MDWTHRSTTCVQLTTLLLLLLLLLLLHHGFDTLSNYESCLIRPFEAKLHPYLTAS